MRRRRAEATNSSALRSHAVISSDLASVYFLPELDDAGLATRIALARTLWPSLHYKPEPCRGVDMLFASDLSLLTVFPSMISMMLVGMHSQLVVVVAKMFL